MEVNNVAPNDVERHIREYSMKNALANEVSTSMVELGIGDTKSRPSRETRLFVSSTPYKFMNIFMSSHIDVVTTVQAGIWATSLPLAWSI